MKSKHIKAILLVTVMAIFASCKKEELPPATCYTFGCAFFHDTLNNPVDSVVTIYQRADIENAEVRRYTRKNSSLNFKSATMFCGPLKYRVEVYNSKPNPEIELKFYANANLTPTEYFRSEKFTGSTIIEGTFVYDLE